MSVEEDIQKAINDKELYLIGEFPPKDWEQVFNLSLPLAKAGDVKAQFNVGYSYAKGEVIDQDFPKALEWYQKAADQNDPRAHYNLSLLYESGLSGLQNSMKAKEHYDRSLELGDDRSKIKTAFANAKEAFKRGDRDQARELFTIAEASIEEAKAGIIACNVIFKSVYSVSIKYSYHSSGAGKNKRHWKWAESLVQEVNVSMTNSSSQSWRVLVKALCRLTDGDYINSTIGGVLRAKEVTANIIDMEKYGDTTICGVEIYSDAAGSVDKPVYKFFFPEIQIKPDAEEQAKLSSKIAAATEEMKVNNKNAKPGCFVLTACYGSYDAPTVFAFRRFRDNYLAQSKLGRNFIAWYYTHGPQWAETISDKPRIKALFRSVFNQLAKILPR